MNKLEEYSVKLSISNIDFSADSNFAKDLGNELAKRKHLKKGKVIKGKNEVIVELTLGSLSQEMAKKQATEELFEVTMAFLKNIDDVRVKVLDE